jgi:putative ABC transport system permease protein
MLTWVKIALRNLWKNSRRSFFTIAAIGLGYAAVNVFGGFTEYIFTSLKDAHIYAQGNGHLTVFKKGFLTNGKLDPFSYLLSEEETLSAGQVVQGSPEVVLVAGQLHISGLLSNGKVSTVFIAVGRVPSALRAIRSRAPGMIGRVKLFEGKQLEDDIVHGIGLSSGLAGQLDLTFGSDVIAMAPTVEGQINALDAQVFQVFKAPNEVIEDQLILVPLKFAQSLYDTSSVDRLTVLLHDTEQTERVKAFLIRELAQRGLEVEVKTWRELASFYDRVKEMFNIIFLFIFVIVFIIVVMSVINTISMAVMERTREIGTLRALGLKSWGIVRLFAIESAMLGLFGSAVGVCLTMISWVAITIIEPTWIPPQITRRIPLEVHLVPEYMVVSMLFLVLLAIVAAIMPARKAARMSIVDALGHA